MAKKAATILAEAQQELLDTNAKLSDTGRRRDQLLLAGDERELDRVEVELGGLQKAAMRQADRIRLLQAEAEREANESRVKERQGLIERNESVLAERDKVGAELQATLALGVKQFRRLIELSENSAAAWPWPASELMASLLSGKAIATAVSHELFRVGTIPFLGGRPGEKVHPSFPGAACPDHRLRGLPEQIPALANVLAQASQHAGRIMRNDPRPVAELAPAPPMPSGNGETPDPVRTTNQERLAKLLKRQAELAEDMTPAGEAAYQQVVAEIAALS